MACSTSRIAERDGRREARGRSGCARGRGFVDEADEAIGVGEGDTEQVCGLFVDLAEDAGGEQPERSADGGERGAQLVADGGDEFILEAVESIALADVSEAEDGTGKVALVEDGRKGVFGGEGAAVGRKRLSSPEAAACRPAARRRAQSSAQRRLAGAAPWSKS